MSDQQLVLLPGHHRLEGSIRECRIDAFDGENALAKLVLSVESHQTKARGVNHPSTTLAIYVEQTVAAKLLLDLHNLSNQLGWSLVDPPVP